MSRAGFVSLFQAKWKWQQEPEQYINIEDETQATSGRELSNEHASDAIDHHRRSVGLSSAVFLIFNRIIGTGIFATPSMILTLSGSGGLTLVMWPIGAIIAFAGTYVYISWGLAIPKNAGEKNYLEYLFQQPRYLMTSIYSSCAILLGWSAGNALVFGEYVLRAADVEPSRWTLRLVGFACVTFVTVLHGVALNWGLRLQNFLGSLKILVLLLVVGTGFVALSGKIEVEKPHNFTFVGTTTSASSFCLSLYNVIYSYIGFSNVNYALSELKNPRRNLRIAGPSAVVVATILYVLANVAYLAGASKKEITGSGRLVAALLFRNVYGPRAERWLSAFVALSALGNVLSVIFTQARTHQALGKEGILPLSEALGSNWPFNTPLGGLILHWIVCTLVIFALPPGDAYNFAVNVTFYPMSVINVVISFGLLYLVIRPRENWPTVDPFSMIAAGFFGIANIFLAVVPFIKPPPGAEPYQELPYWTHAVAGWAVFGIGLLYWVVWAVLLPEIGRYTLRSRTEVGKDGLLHHTIVRTPLTNSD